MSYDENIPEYALVPAKNPKQPNEFEFVEVQKKEIKKEETVQKAEAIEEKKEKVKDDVYVAADNKMDGDIIKIEKEIDEYKAVEAEYSNVTVTKIDNLKEHTFSVEEDVLVPDIKPDLLDILLMGASVEIREQEIEKKNNKNSSIAVKGNLCLQTVYKPENSKAESLMVIDTKTAFATSWLDNITSADDLKIEITVNKISYLVVNERKFRVKVSLIAKAKQYDKESINVFRSLSDDSIQLRKKKIEITDVALKKENILAIDDVIEFREKDKMITDVLKKDVSVVQGYKQVTGEKIVINGFIYCNLLIVVKSENDEKEEFAELRGKVEFTQFIPLNQSGPWSGSDIKFDSGKLKIEIEDNEGSNEIKVKGDLITCVELYKNIEKEVVFDAYHTKHDLKFDFKNLRYQTLIGNGVSEITAREIMNIPNNCQIEKVIYSEGKVLSYNCYVEQGKVIVEGIVEGRVLCISSNNDLMTLNCENSFKTYIDVPDCKENDCIECEIKIKDSWADKINNNQMEFNVNGIVSIQVMRNNEIKILENPKIHKIEQNGTGKIVVYIAKRDDDLWRVAKRYKTTVAMLREINDIADNENIKCGDKMLITK